MSRNFLSRNEELRRGDSLMSNNGQFKAVFQDDGNFVLYGWNPMWSSKTSGTDAIRLVMQSDCNLVMYNCAGVAKWSSGTAGAECAVCSLRVGDEGGLVVCKKGEPVWAAE